ncbi:sigma-70 family RNA polymerase sigma factor [bacterium]|nr:sigma-70 family RNA polymerase sigma factor [candidate division CSSED10-310 bacterium]
MTWVMWSDFGPMLEVVQRRRRDALVEGHLEYARQIARRIHRSLGLRIELSELDAWGRLGLLQAAGSYDHGGGSSFKTFAHYRIRGAIYDGLRQIGCLTRDQYAKVKFSSRADDLMSAESSATRTECSETLEQKAGRLLSIASDLVPVFLLSCEGTQDLTSGMEDGGKSPEEEVSLSEERAILADLMEGLSDRERLLITMYYYQDKPLSDVAQELRLSKSWVSRMHNTVIRKLRDRMRERGCA